MRDHRHHQSLSFLLLRSPARRFSLAGGRVGKPRILPDPIRAPAATDGPVQLFRSARFALSVADPAGLPPAGVPEIAFAGRSNSGKSTAINVLTQQKRLAFASKTPGRTQLLNFFELSEPGERGERVSRAYLVDLPGYGYARAPESQRAQWDVLVGSYVARRQSLVGIVVVMDARRPLLPADEHLIAFIDRPSCALHLLLTKADQLNRSEQRSALDGARRRAAELGERASAQLFSALRRQGVEELEQTLAAWLPP
jgi:GTP-binding protein